MLQGTARVPMSLARSRPISRTSSCPCPARACFLPAHRAHRYRCLHPLRAQYNPDRRDGEAALAQERRDWVPPSPPPNGSRPRFPPEEPPNPGPSPGAGGPNGLTKAFIAGAFVLGMGAGIWFDTQVTFQPQNVASTVLVDTKTPNSELCMANGYSSMVFDQRIFLSFNPFNVYVAQPEVKPGCVLRRSNVGVLERRGLVDGDQVSACKRSMNTFAFVGDLAGRPEVACVYHSEDAENQFLRDPKMGTHMRGVGVMPDGTAAPAARPGAE
uniref:DUF3172 domain-containing protein n=2 Tax=Auxenochlorella protothecoides TaxID=3075 RepID=A0A1D1ZVM4_AUXPR